MRSLLIQAASVEKAFEKGWLDAGMPTQFTIKVLDFGEKGFFGITTKKPAIISIMYEPRNQTSLGKVRKPKPKQQQRLKQPRKIEKKQIKKQPQPSKKEVIFWTIPMINDMTAWLQEIIKLLGFSETFKTSTTKKALTITFNKALTENKDDERLLFSSLSYLLINFMKKKQKKKLQGYQIILTSKKPQKKA